MSETLRQIQTLVRAGDVEVSRHGLLELAADAISLGSVIARIDLACVVKTISMRSVDHPCFAGNLMKKAMPFTSFGAFR